MKKMMRVLLLMVAMVGVLVGCGKKEEEDKKNILRVAIDSELTTLDPVKASSDIPFEAITATREGFYNLDKDGNPVPGTADSVDISDDKKTYTFHIREDAKWSNGKPVTADDFVFGWRRMVDPNSAALYGFIFDIAGVKNAKKVMHGELPLTALGIEAVDAKTAKVTLDKPTSFFMGLMSFGSFFPVNEKFYNEVGDNFALGPEYVLSNGPFKLVDWRNGYGFRMEKNENYYNKDKINLDGIEFRVIKDPQTAALKFENGELDIVKLSSELLDKYKDKKEFKTFETSYMNYLSINNQRGPLKNLNLRKAIATSIDKKYIVESLLNDGSYVADYFIPKNFAKSPDGRDFREDAKEFLKYDTVKGNEYFEKAKKELGEDRITIELMYADNESAKKICEYIQSELETNLKGLIVTLKPQPSKSRSALLNKRAYDISLSMWIPDYSDPQTFLDMYMTEHSMNRIAHENKAYDEVMERAMSGVDAGDDKARWSDLIEAERILLEDDAAVAPLYQKGYSYLINTNVTGLKNRSSGTPFTYEEIVKK